MTSLDFRRYALCSGVTAAMFAGCGAPTGVPTAITQAVL
jgi:hypothetical protein